MAFTISKILLAALYVAIWSSGFPTLAGEAAHCGTENFDLSILEFCFLDGVCCGLTASCPQVAKCFDDRSCSDALGCEVPGISAPATSTLTCAPSQTCATSMITVAASTRFITFACFDVSTSIVEDNASISMSMLMLFGNLAPTSSATYDTDQAVWTTVTQVSGTDDTYPFYTTATNLQPEYPPLSTGTSLYTSTQLATAATTMAQYSTSDFSASTSTAHSTWPTGAQATPSNTKVPNHTAMIIGVVSGSLTGVAIIWVSLDYLYLRLKHHRRHSISDCSDDNILEHHENEKQVPYGYYGTNRAGTIPKDTSAREVNTEPAELPAEVVADDRV
ncbi:hypothetical protein VPNG_02647 [Cytospora leucostoma]|uniref:Extracellular membrane protein CFEM domain-containing protein n=1 Tax=Cytospora leucostoma TaxID=1230097 RepID=A0A423XI71_9PEZI|nr:hypothetical protein VPNG_02647 [Cytospora leucostoma]